MNYYLSAPYQTFVSLPPHLPSKPYSSNKYYTLSRLAMARHEILYIYTR